MIRTTHRFLSIALGLSLLSASLPLAAQTKLKPGFNLFSVEQDIAIGRQSAQEVERQLPILDDRQIQNYVSAIGQRLARQAQGAEYPYQFKVVNVSDINAFALPGGFMYVNRGLVETARSEAELAGVMAHEIGHVALRHGTNQASKAYLAQAGLGIAGMLLGGGQASNTEQVIQAIGGFGLNTVFLKFSRNAEKQADLVGAQMMARAGYDPMAMADFFELLHEQSGKRSDLATFFSSHPAPENRARRIQEESERLDFNRPAEPVGDFRSIQSRLEGMSDAPSMADLAGRQGQGTAGGGPVDVGDIERPSDRLTTYRGSDLYRVRHPVNWQVLEHRQGLGVTIAPQGGAGTSRGQPHIVYGMMVEIHQPQYRRGSLQQDSQELLERLARDNNYLRLRQSLRRTRLDGRQALYAELAGRSPVTGEDELVEVFTRRLSNGALIYLLFIVPERDLRDFTGQMRRILDTFEVRD